MALTNRDRVGKALELLQAGLTPYIQREMEAEYKGQWLKQAGYSLRNFDEADPHWDAHALLLLMWEQWNVVFGRTLGHAERSIVSELREVRNAWAHQKPFSTDDAYRALDSMARLLTAISAPEARELESQKQDLLRLRFAEQERHERRKASAAPMEGQPQGGLSPWREIVTPHPDVSSGRYLQAEFAADLAAVHRGDVGASAEYKDPKEFYRRTYLTDGLRGLVSTAVKRLSGLGGDPVVELQTNFGGGKTHSMLALYHLVSGVPAGDLPGVESVLNELGISSAPKANVAVLVGTALSPGQANIKLDGIRTKTLWGEMAWQLGGAEGYALVAQADESGVNPGSNVLYDLFTRFTPSLILIDEWVAFLRQLYKKDDGLPAGSFDANLSFAQSLTEAVKQAPGTLLVATLPASDIEIGGEGGRQALARLQNTFSRTESSWRPASAEESFEIVRRRLFQPIDDPRKFAARDAVTGTFARFYREQPQEFPPNCREAEYERRMQAAYPIHPELFDRLYNDWSTLERFQRTRGVLRLMAAVIHALWERQDTSLLILPASIPMDDSPVQAELTRYMEDNWIPVIEKDVDGPSSLPLALDREHPNLGRYSAARRVARTIYIGSAPTVRTNNPGLDDRNVKLGCAQPGETVATFGDALRRLSDNATHLYINRNRYWFSTQPSVTRLAQDRAGQVENDIEVVWEEIRRRLRLERSRGDLAGVHSVPASSADVPDEMGVRLVILDPKYPHALRDDKSEARQEIRTIFSQRGNAPRIYQNMLVFLAPDRSRLTDLQEAVAQYLAWKSIHDERESLNLDSFQRNQASTRSEQANETVDARIKESYVWLIVPVQSDPRDPATLAWQEHRLQGQEALAVRASRKLVNNEQLVTEFAPLRLMMEMERFNLWQGGDHVGVKQLWEYFARYPYLTRLRDQGVLLEAIRSGINLLTWRDNFAYAGSWDEERKRYLNLVAGSPVSAIPMDSHSVLVKAEAAQRQLDAEAVVVPYTPKGPSTDKPVGMPQPDDSTPGPIPPQPREKNLRRFYGSVTLNPMRLGRDAGAIGEEILQHLSTLVGADVNVTLEIHVSVPDGVPDGVVRTVSENARTLKFDSFGFEES